MSRRTTTEFSKFEHFNRYVDFAMRHLHPVERSVFVALWRRSGRTGAVRFSMSWLADVTGSNRSRAKSAVIALAKCSLINDVKMGNNWKHSEARIDVNPGWEKGQLPRLIVERNGN